MGRLAAVASCLFLIGCGQPAARKPAPTPTQVLAPKPTETFFIHLLDSRRFDPAELHGKPGQLVKLVLVGDRAKHDFTSTRLNVNQDVLPMHVEVLLVKLPAVPGQYAFWSAQPGDREAGMEGKFIVG